MPAESYVHCKSAEAYAKRFPHLPPNWYEGADLYNRRTGRMMDQPQRGEELCRPNVCSDTPDYTSPSTYEVIQHRDGRRELRHKVISGRRQRREDLKRNNCEEMDPPGTMHRFVSSKYAPTLKQRQPRRPKLVPGEDRVLNNKLEAVWNGARGV